MMAKDNLQLDKHISSACEDYIRDEGDEDIFCFNNKWKCIVYCIRGRQRPVCTYLLQT